MQPHGPADDAPRPKRLTVHTVPTTQPGERAVAMLIARSLGLPLTEARMLLARLPAVLPKALDAPDADALVSALEAAGATAGAAPRSGELAACAAHPSFEAAQTCARCGAVICALCAAASAPAGLCPACAVRALRTRTFFRARMTVLLVVLAGVLLYAWKDISGRRARNDWERTLQVGLVIVRLGPVDDASIGALRDRVRALEDVLAAESARYRGPGSARPIEVVVFGPVDVAEPPPAPAGDGLLDLARYAYAKSRYTARIDEAAGVVARALDSRIYLLARPGNARGTNFVEGVSEEGGRSGFVEVDLEKTMVDFALFVFAHELCHTLGATDKYDESGATMIPEGLAEPDANPRFPQRFVEVMARGRPLGPGRERAPDGLDELRVGPMTAREIGWMGKLAE
jgi:hypothetical protein